MVGAKKRRSRGSGVAVTALPQQAAALRHQIAGRRSYMGNDVEARTVGHGCCVNYRVFLRDVIDT